MCIINKYKNKERRKNMQYMVLSIQPKDAEKKLNALGAQGWKVVSQSESTWVINKCCGLSNSIDAVINITLEKN